MVGASSKIICGHIGDGGTDKLNEDIAKLEQEGYIAEDISIASPSFWVISEICVLLRKKGIDSIEV